MIRRLGLALAVAASVLAIPSPALAVAASATECVTSSETVLVVCVDVSDQKAAVLLPGRVVLDLGTVTTSRTDSDCRAPRRQFVNCGGVGDHITPFGRWKVSCTDDRTGTRPDPCNPVSNGLRWLAQFPNGTAWNTSLHYYSDVGSWADSHGCIRIGGRGREWLARQLWDLIRWWQAVGGTVVVDVKL
jgi:hypothetical protein